MIFKERAAGLIERFEADAQGRVEPVPAGGCVCTAQWTSARAWWIVEWMQKAAKLIIAPPSMISPWLLMSTTLSRPHLAEETCPNGLTQK